MTHLLFIDDVFFFGRCSLLEIQVLSRSMGLFTIVTGMQINDMISCILFHKVEEDIIGNSLTFFPFPHKDFKESLKYLGLKLNPLAYKFNDWIWLYNKIEAQIFIWVK